MQAAHHRYLSAVNTIRRHRERDTTLSNITRRLLSEADYFFDVTKNFRLLYSVIHLVAVALHRIAHFPKSDDLKNIRCRMSSMISCSFLISQLPSDFMYLNLDVLFTPARDAYEFLNIFLGGHWLVDINEDRFFSLVLQCTFPLVLSDPNEKQVVPVILKSLSNVSFLPRHERRTFWNTFLSIRPPLKPWLGIDRREISLRGASTMNQLAQITVWTHPFYNISELNRESLIGIYCALRQKAIELNIAFVGEFADLQDYPDDAEQFFNSLLQLAPDVFSESLNDEDIYQGPRDQINAVLKPRVMIDKDRMIAVIEPDY